MSPTHITPDALAQEIAARAGSSSRYLVAVAGPPGAGKSTLAARLVQQLGAGAAVMPMDGFHLENDVLEARGLLHRKGAPETFDAQGFVQLVTRLRDAEEIPYPTFDRAADRTVPQGGRIAKETRIVVIEGNYLMLDTAPWSALADRFDLTVRLEVARPVLEARLIQRWLDHGLDPDAARTRARQNDLRNADVMEAQSRAADFVVPETP